MDDSVYTEMPVRYDMLFIYSVYKTATTSQKESMLPFGTSRLIGQVFLISNRRAFGIMNLRSRTTWTEEVVDTQEVFISLLFYHVVLYSKKY